MEEGKGEGLAVLAQSRPRPFLRAPSGILNDDSSCNTLSFLFVSSSPVTYFQIATVADGREWSPERSPARNWAPFGGGGTSGGMKNSYSYSAQKHTDMQHEFGLTESVFLHFLTIAVFGTVESISHFRYLHMLEKFFA